MIQIETIEIREFRGIRDLKLDLGGKNFATCGPNGTGKSGIVDAIEFALTGNVSRLTGSGTGGLSVKDHGPHVDSRNKPEKAEVSLSVIIPSLNNKKATIRRTVKAASAPTITPGDADVKAAFDNVKLHPEFVLSRREIIRYVLAEPSKRSKEITALLRMDDIEKLRVSLQKIANACERELPTLDRLEKDAVKQLRDALGIAELTASAVLAAVNPKRELLGLAPLAALEATTSLKDGLATATGEQVQARVAKAQAKADVDKIQDALKTLNSKEFTELYKQLELEVAELEKDPAVLDGVSREALFQSALKMFDEKACPVCDTTFDPQHFRQHLNGKLKHLEEITAKRKALESRLGPILEVMLLVGTLLNALIGYGPQLKPAVDVTSLKDFKAILLSRYQQLQKLLPLDATQAALAACQKVVDLAPTITAIETAIAAIPEPTKQDAARDFLIVGQEKLAQYREAKQRLAVATVRSERASKAFDLYGTVVTTALEEVYGSVEDEFSTYYRKVNHDDENEFTAKLLPSIGKLGFDVDFYGRGQFPPGAYHSEGHQDGMGLCLYLALMNHLQGENFTFAVLDDVLMSVDVGHRREVCTLLKEMFPNTQFVFTTHDEIWLRHMKSEGLIKGRNFAHFRTWHVDIGPKEWKNTDVWTDAAAHLAKNDVRSAAGLLRHYLEHFAKEACDRLRASVEFRGDALFTLGDLLPNAVQEFGSLLKKAKAAANSWNQTDVIDAVNAREMAFNDAKKKVNHDNWQVNAAVHFNDWDNLQKNDFEPVVAAFKELTSAFKCSTCEEMFYVTPEREPKKEGLRCGCGSLNLNLVPKQ